MVTRLRQGYGGQVRLLYACRNGFVRRSWPIVVGGPWPERTVTSSPSGNSFLLIPLINRSISPPGRSPRPMLPAKRTSPPQSSRSLGEKKQRLPGQWPGTSSTLEIGTEKTSVWCFFNQKIWFDWFDLEREPKVAKEIAIRNHGRGKRVTSDLGVKLPFNFGNVLNVINVPVRQQQKFGMDIKGTDPFARTVRCVEQDPSFRRFEQITIGFKDPAAKGFESRRCHITKF